MSETPGDRNAEQQLPLLYDELRRLAAQRLNHEAPGQTLQATALVHEAYLRLVGADPAKHWDGRGHFFAAAAEAMRRILVENARRKGRIKHGGGQRRAELPDVPAPTPDDALLALDDALTRLGRRGCARRQGSGAASFRRAGARGNGGGARRHGLRRPAEMGLRPRLASGRPAGRMIFSIFFDSRARKRRMEG
jgi:hypothetical protein